MERGDNRPTFVFCVNRRHAQHIAQRFVEVGVACEYMDGTTSREDREASFNRFRSGETWVIANVGVLTTGIDLDVRCIVLARPTQSRILHVQIIGRGLRTAPGKYKLIVLDHAGNHLRLGMVTDITQDIGSTTGPSAAKQAESGSAQNRCRGCARTAMLSSPEGALLPLLRRGNPRENRHRGRRRRACGARLQALRQTRARSLGETSVLLRTAVASQAAPQAALAGRDVPAEVRALAEWLRANRHGAVAGDPQLGEVAADRVCEGPDDGVMRRRNSISEAWAARPIEMLESPAYRALSLSAHRVLSRIEIEFAHQGGQGQRKAPCHIR
jgi:hypothetical protein